MHEGVWSLIRGGIRYKVNGGQPGLPPGRHEHEGGFLRRVRADRGVRWLVHSHHPRAVELSGVTLYVTLQRHRSHRRLEVEEAALWSLLLLNAEPVCEIVRVGQRRGKADDSYRSLGAGGYESHAAHDHLEDRPAVGAEQVDLINHHQRNLGDVRPGLPLTRDAVPLLRGAHDYVCALKRAYVRRVVARQLHELFVENLAQLPFPVLDTLPDQRLERCYVDNLTSRVVPERRHHRELRADRLTGTRGRAEQHVRFGMEQCVERLRLDLVEKLELALVEVKEFLSAELWVLGWIQRLPGHWGQVKQLRVRGSPIG